MLRKMIKLLSGKISGLSGNESRSFKLAVTVGVVVVAAVMLIFAGQSQKPEKVKAEQTSAETVEQRLEEILAGIKGAGSVKVMVVFKDDGKDNIAMNTEYYEDSDGSIKTNNTAVTGQNKEVVVVSKSIPEVQGVIVTSQGADNPAVKENIKKAVAAALPVPSHRIEVLVGE